MCLKIRFLITTSQELGCTDLYISSIQARGHTTLSSLIIRLHTQMSICVLLLENTQQYIVTRSAYCSLSCQKNAHKKGKFNSQQPHPPQTHWLFKTAMQFFAQWVPITLLQNNTGTYKFILKQ